MSLQTWLEEFYPNEASEYANASWLDAAKHSLQKWKGALPENLEKHNMAFLSDLLIDKNGRFGLAFSACSCSLCEKALALSLKVGGGKCHSCAMFSELRITCFDDLLYSKSLGDPQLMVDVLQKLVDKLEEKEKI